MGLRSLFIASLASSLAASASATCSSTTKSTLQSRLSSSATVSTSPFNSRWSEYEKPVAALYVRPSVENDVAATVGFANNKSYPFLVQNGGIGWADTWTLGTGCSIIIDISSLNKVTFNSDKTLATIQGGIMTEDLVKAAYAAGTRMSNPTCPCLGYLGAILGGGQTKTAGADGMSVDTLVSAKVVLASGQMVTASASSNSDLFWAIKGSAANFGVVTSAVVKAFPQSLNAWQGFFLFSEDKLATILQVLKNLTLTPQMQYNFLYTTGPAPTYAPQIQVAAFYYGNTSAAEKAYASVINAGPFNKSSSAVTYDHWDDEAIAFCKKGLRKPAYASSISGIDVPTYQKVFAEYKSFVATNPSALNNSIVLAEFYPLNKIQANGDASSSYPFRSLPLHTIAIPWYSNSSLDAQARTWGQKVRNLWWSTGGTSNSTYINFAHGDETLQTTYGGNVARLQSLKSKYDPKNRFNQWFPLIK